jgi:hypothetical protein
MRFLHLPQSIGSKRNVVTVNLTVNLRAPTRSHCLSYVCRCRRQLSGSEGAAALHCVPLLTQMQGGDSGRMWIKHGISAQTYDFELSEVAASGRSLRGPCHPPGRASCPPPPVRAGRAHRGSSIHRATCSIGPRPRCFTGWSSGTFRISVNCVQGKVVCCPTMCKRNSRPI